MATVTAPAPAAPAVAVPVAIYAHSTSTKYGGQLALPTGVTYKVQNTSYINATASNKTSWAMVTQLLATGPCTMGTLRNCLQQAYGHQCFVGYNQKRGKLIKVPYKKGLQQITPAQIQAVFTQFGITKPYKNPKA
jgi:hypothetical protein